MGYIRRNLTAEQVAERAGLSRLTVHRIEQGSPSVAIGSYLQVLVILGLEAGLASAASVDELGRKLQDLGLSAKKRVSKKRIKSKPPFPLAPTAVDEHRHYGEL